MNALEQVLSLIPQNEVTDLPIGNTISVQAAVDVLAAVEGIDCSSLKLGILHLLLRTLETFLLADNVMLDIARYPSIYLGKADDVIRGRISELLGVTPPVTLVHHLRKCLTSHAAREGEKGSITAYQVREVFLLTGSNHPRRELRCAVCGYHFQRHDVGVERRELADDIGLVFADEFDPGRLNDDMKPQRFTQLEIDHIVPEEGLGWSGTDNYQITCQFCNGGRLIFRRSLEPLSTMMAGALSAFPPNRPHRITRQVIVVAALCSSGFRCSKCSATIMDRELTTQLQAEHVSSRMWCVPWNLDVTCYRCWNG